MRASTPRAACWLPGVLCLAVNSITACGNDPGPGPDGFPTGVIQVAVSTTGPDPDPDGYVANIEGGGYIPVPVSGSASFNGVADGDYTLSLSSLASNCVADPASTSATVIDGATAMVSFAVTCSAIPPTVGSIRVVTSTIGSNPDLDGYQFSIDNGPAQAIGTTATATVDNLALGMHTVVISGLASNCGIPRGWVEEPTLTAGSTADALFPVTCHETGPSLSQSTIQVDPASMPIGFPDMIFLPRSTITVTVVDPSGTPLAGFGVTVGASGSGNTLYPTGAGGEPGTTDARGMTTFTFSSTDPGTKVITATVNEVASLENTQVITVVKALSFVFIGGGDPEPSTAGETVVVTVQVSGQHGAQPRSGTVAVRSNLEPDAGCAAAPVTFDGQSSTATCEMTLTIVSTHMLTATYSGDSQFEGSTGAAVEHVVIAP